MEKINFVNNSEPDISAENLNLMQTNVDEAKIDRTPSTPFSGDLNDIKTTSFIYASGSTINIPRKGYSFYMTTIALKNNYIYQEAKRVANSMAAMETFERQCFNGTWTDWKQTNIPIVTTTEFKTGKIIDGKEEYGKLINLGNLPNASTKNVPHGINNFTTACNITKIEGFAQGDNTSCFPLPYSSPSDLTSCIGIIITNSNISVVTGNDRSSLTGHVTLYYTKNN